MKKELLIFLLLLTVSLLPAQTIFDDFESYNDGDKISASSSTWTTWSGGTAAEDTPVSTDQAHSGTKSLKFVGAAGGGPADIILPLGAKYTSGSAEFEFYIYIETGKGAYFNLQGNTTPGQVYLCEYFFSTDNYFAGSRFNFGKHYTKDSWTKVNIQIDLDHNIWTIFLDDEYIGSYPSPTNTLAGVDFYCRDASDKFYIDDVSFTYDATPVVLPELNAHLNEINKHWQYLAATTPNTKAIIRNTGAETISSLDFALTSASGVSETALTDLNIESLAQDTIELGGLIGNLEAGLTYYSLVISKVNGNIDADSIDNKLDFSMSATEPTPHKKVLIEEGTGTWCQWCPRGAIFMDQMAERYPEHFVGIAVHVGVPSKPDPMEVDNYPASVGFESFPSMANERRNIFGFGTLGDVELQFFTSVDDNPVAKVNSGITFDEDTRLLSITAQADFLENASEQYKLSVILTEDHVTGTTSGYSQANAYAGGGNGPMGGYENLPSTVPASQMVYDHVARALISPFNGAPSSIPVDAVDGQSYTFQMPDYTIPSDFDIANLHIVTLLINSQNQVVNVNSQSFDEAMNFVLGDNYVASGQDLMQIAPNPIATTSSLYLDLESPANVSMQVFNSMGQIIHTQHFGRLTGKNNLPFDAGQWSKGIYLVKLQLDNRVISQKIIVQ